MSFNIYMQSMSAMMKFILDIFLSLICENQTLLLCLYKETLHDKIGISLKHFTRHYIQHATFLHIRSIIKGTNQLI